MAKVYVICILVFFTISVLCQHQENSATGLSLDQLIDQVFTTPKPIIDDSSNYTVGGGIPGTDQCTCVPYYLCKNGTVITNGEGVIDIRISEGPCFGSIDICCNAEHILEKPTPPIPKFNTKSGCGYRNAEGTAFRISGNKENEAQYGEFPWMVAVLHGDPVGSGKILYHYQCGGALIHPRVVLTAAHCVRWTEKKIFKIRAGEWDTQTRQELYPHQERRVERVVSHSDYYAGALHNDVALLLLESPVDIAENVDVICLPPQDANFDHSRCFASGWGKDVFGQEGKYQVILKKLELAVVPKDACLRELRKTRLGQRFELHSSFVCAGGENGKDTCKGDGGSPLVCPIKGETERYAQVGIVAWGIGCGESNTPGVYANVAKFRNWIDSQLNLLDIHERPYEHV